MGLPYARFWLLVCCLIFGELAAQSIYTIDAAYPVHPLDDHLRILPDSAVALSPQQLARDTSLPWVRRADLPKWLPVGRAYYARMALRATDTLRGWELHLEDRLYNDINWIRGNGRVDVWAYADGYLLWHRVTGADVPAGERDLDGHRTQDRVRLTLPVDRPVNLLLRVEGNSFGIYPQLRVSLRAPDYQHFQPYLPSGVIYNTFLSGLTFIILLYHLLLFVFLREPVYGWFSLWLLLSALTQAMTVGLEPVDWLGVSGGNSRFFVWLIIPHTMLFAFWFFGRAFVESRTRYPLLHRLMLVPPLGMAAYIVLAIGYFLLWEPQVFITMFGWHYQIIAGFAVVGLGLGIALVLKKHTLSRIFGAGAILGSTGIIVGALWALRLLRVPFDPFGTAILLQVMIYSLGIAYRRGQRARAARETELAAERSRGEVERMRGLDEIKARFFANVSHEFRTPLTLISGPLDMARETSGGIFLHGNDYRVVRANVDRLQRLVEQLLELARLESGSLMLKVRSGGLVDFVRTRVLSFSSLAESAHLSLDVSFPDRHPAALYDAEKLETIIVNLLANAIKYSPPAGRIRVTMDFEDEYFWLEVADTGPGIPADQLESIFDRFYRVDGTEAAGSGIGLALSRELVEAYGGTISVRSKVGKGTTFRLRLPCTLDSLPEAVRADEQPTAPPTPTRTARGTLDPAAAPAAGGGQSEQTVLIVEDSDQLRSFIGRVVKDRYAVLLAADGLSGERLAQEHVPDLVVSDVMMPGQDGYALCHALKHNPKTSHIPVILLTAKAGHDSTLTGLRQGADDYLTKPFDPAELLLRIANLLATRERLWERFRSLDLSLLPEVDDRSIEDRFLQDVIRAIKEHLGDERFSVEELAGSVGYSRSQLTRKLKAIVGKTPNRLITEMRLQEARRLLENRAGSVSEIAYLVGYTNLSYFAKTFREQFGELPSAVRQEAGTE